MNNKISVCVVSYNSEKTIIETLDSILFQSFGSENIELIISDDFSKDNTKDIVRHWLNVNENKFFNVIGVFNNKNIGISGNCNQAWKHASSMWIKSIAADDVLLPDCLLDNYNYCSNKKVDCLFSLMECFSDKECLNKILPSIDKLGFFELSAEEQFKKLSIESFNFAPTSFIKKEVLVKVNYCDDKYRLIEDLPLWLRITGSNIKLSFLNKVTVKYRVGNSLSNSSSRLVNLAFIDQIEILHKELIWPNFKRGNKWRILDKKIDFFSWRLTAKLFNNKRTVYSVGFRYVILVIRPSSYIAVKKIIVRFLNRS